MTTQDPQPDAQIPRPGRRLVRRGHVPAIACGLLACGLLAGCGAAGAAAGAGTGASAGADSITLYNGQHRRRGQDHSGGPDGEVDTRPHGHPPHSSNGTTAASFSVAAGHGKRAW